MNQLLIFVALLAGGYLAVEIGFRLGRLYAPQDETLSKQLDVIRGASFALVAFLLGFAFSGAGTRFVDRLDVIVKEANALGTAWLRADVLPEPQRGELKAVLREYTADRVAILGGDSIDERRRLMGKVGGLHSRMWALGRDATQGNPPLAMLVLPPLNDVIDLHTTHVAAALRHLPLPILAVLLASTALVLALVGFSNGRVGRRFPMLDIVYTLLLAIALWMTVDLDHPREGIIRLTHQPLVDALAGMR
jgi:hypothetical protein